MQQPNVAQLVAGTIINTALLCNEFIIQTKGKFILAASDYLHLVPNFNHYMSKQIVVGVNPTEEDLKRHVKSFVKETLDKFKEQENANESGNQGETGQGAEGV